MHSPASRLPARRQSRRAFVLPLFAVAAMAVGLLAGCGSLPPVDPAVRQALAPSGSLRVGVYPGSPTSLVVDGASGQRAGIALELGTALGRRLDVPVQLVQFDRVAQVVDAVKSGAVDMTFTNATAVRARDVDFAAPLVMLELGFVVPPDSGARSAADIDRAGLRVGVTQGSSSQAALAQQFKNATLVPANSVQHAQELLRKGEVQAYATNKAILNEMLRELPGFRILDGRWGVENMAIAVPKGRVAALPFLQQFGRDMQASGQLPAIIQRSGLKGTVTTP